MPRAAIKTPANTASSIGITGNLAAAGAGTGAGTDGEDAEARTVGEVAMMAR